MSQQHESQSTRTLEILERTPRVLRGLLEGLPPFWLEGAEPGGGWSPNQLLAHWIHGEVEDWIPRMRIILSDSASRTFAPFDPELHTEFGTGQTTSMLLDRFETIRSKNVSALCGANVTSIDLARTGQHPTFGEVTLSELLATWATHDLSHIAQVARVMAKRHAKAVGPWRAFIPILANR